MSFTKESLLAFIRKDTDTEARYTKETAYYLHQFEHNKGARFFVSWNWSAAFFGVIWMLYRRMYVYAIIYLLLKLATPPPFSFLSAWPYITFVSTNTSHWIDLGLFFVQGLFGNALYLDFARRKVQKGVLHSGVNDNLIFLILIAFIIFYYYGGFFEVFFLAHHIG